MSEQIPPVPPELEGLFEAERARGDESPARRERVARRLESSVVALAVGAAAGGAVAVAGAKLAAGGLALSAARRVVGEFVRLKAAATVVAATVVAGGVGGAVGYKAGEHAVEARQARQAVTAPTAPRSSAREAPAVPSMRVEDLPRAPSAAPSSSARSSGAERSDGAERDAQLAGELALVQMARTALVRGDAAGALDAAETHRRRFPDGRLVEERESVAIQALARLGRSDEARARAAAFERRYPNSVLLPVIRAVVGGGN